MQVAAARVRRVDERGTPALLTVELPVVVLRRCRLLCFFCKARRQIAQEHVPDNVCHTLAPFESEGLMLNKVITAQILDQFRFRPLGHAERSGRGHLWLVPRQ